MYLKRIEVSGFKSFANRMNLDFTDGITCIVGPNGSGKSNVADAVRWVLGEQSAKQLRGSNMQDVIFSGTENRKPQGMAYVAITMDNRDRSLAVDCDEVTVSRRVYRSGESEYMMNGAACRLRDIQELFYESFWSRLPALLNLKSARPLRSKNWKMRRPIWSVSRIYSASGKSRWGLWRSNRRRPENICVCGMS